MRAIVAMDRLVAKRPLKQHYFDPPTTLGEVVRQHRLRNDLLQKEVASILNVKEMTITNWENNYSQIQSRFIPSIIKFLGFVPEMLQDYKPLESDVFLYRCKHGITQKAMAKQLGVDPSTLHAIEWGKRNLHSGTVEKLKLS